MSSEASRLMQRLGAIIAASSDIQEYCAAEFGRGHTVHVGVNNEAAPPEGSYPLVAIFSAERFRGEGANRRRYAVEIGIGVMNDQILNGAPENPNLYFYPGLQQAEDIRELVEDAVFAAGLGKTDVEGDTRSEVYFPLFRSDTSITVELVTSSRKPLGR